MRGPDEEKTPRSHSPDCAGFYKSASIKKDSGRHRLPAKKLLLFNTFAKSPRNCLPGGISSGRGVYTLISMSGVLFKARILTYITYIKYYFKYVNYTYIFTHDCQIPDKPKLKEPFAFLGPNAPTLSTPSCA